MKNSFTITIEKDQHSGFMGSVVELPAVTLKGRQKKNY